MNQKNDLTKFEKTLMKAVNKPVARKKFVHQLRSELISQMEKPRSFSSWVLKPAWALGAAVLLALVVVASSPRIVNALQRVFRYLPAIGMVENQPGLLILEEQVSQTQSGITLTLMNAAASSDRVVLSYRTEGIPAGMAFDPSADLGSEDDYCFGERSYPELVFADGSKLTADPHQLGGAWEDGYQSFTAGYSFSGHLPEDTADVELVLACLNGLPRSEAPENWQLTFRLNPVDDASQIGEDVLQTSTAADSEAGITLTVEKLIKEGDGYVFYTDLAYDQSDPSLLSIFPYRSYVSDDSGEKIMVSHIFHQGPWDVRENDAPVVLKTAGIPEEGDLTLVVDQVQAFFSPDQELVPAGNMFRFEAGADPQLGQQWDLEYTFAAGGHAFELVSAELIEKDSRQGYQFVFHTADPGQKMSVDLIDGENKNLWTSERTPPGDTFTGTLLYDGQVPSTVNVTLNWVSVVIDGDWEVVWKHIAE